MVGWWRWRWRGRSGKCAAKPKHGVLPLNFSFIRFSFTACFAWTYQGIVLQKALFFLKKTAFKKRLSSTAIARYRQASIKKEKLKVPKTPHRLIDGRMGTDKRERKVLLF